MSNERILVVEDEQAIGDLLAYHLEREGYRQIVRAATGEEALAEVNKFRPDLILLDLMLPGISGLDVCRKLKEKPNTADIPIIILTAKSDESDIIVGLEMGAEDYITKPFSMKILIVRIRSVLRRATRSITCQEKDPLFNAGPIRMNLLTREVWIDGSAINLTVSEFNLLFLLADNQDRVFTRNQLIEELRGDDYPVTERAMDVLVLSVRKKLKTYSGMIETIRGIGYRFSERAVL